MKILIMILKNTGQGTFHPILYLEKPLPGNTQIESATRFKSKLHHTSGFATMEEAVTDAKALAPKVAENFAMYSAPIMDLDTIGEWDGKDVPATTIFYNCDNKQMMM